MHQLKVTQAIKAAESIEGARLIVFGDAQLPEVGLPLLMVSVDQSPLDRALWIRGKLSSDDLVHCLDMEAALDLFASRLDAQIILDPQALPSLT